VEVDLIAITPDSERLIERAGRTCYMSQERAEAETAGKFLRMLVSKGHLSVLEHAYATFRIRGISRAATHQIVRHRLCSFSQKSQRYVREVQNGFITPLSVLDKKQALAVFRASVEASFNAYRDLLNLGIPKEDARFVMPNATASEIVVSANFRELRHIIEVRGSRDAQWEIKQVAVEILRLIKQQAPNVFFDLAVGSDGCVEIKTTE
jgi:thymidylate synthase (FAD)